MLLFLKEFVMRLKDKYFEIKSKYGSYIIIMKSGTFYNVFGRDCYILNNIFGYKINGFSDTIKVGFPMNTLNKVINTFDKLKINYIVYEGDITLKEKFHRNQYEVFLKEKLTIAERIERINLILKENKNEEEIIQILNRIEAVL